MKGNSLQEIHKILERIFRDLNRRFYNSELETPIITIMSSNHEKLLGWCSMDKVWSSIDPETNLPLESKQTFREINICASALNRPTVEIAETLLHEMAHLYNSQNNINDTSRAGYYHNKRFANTAKKHGLICNYTKSHGYASTHLSDDARQYIQKRNYPEFELNRRTIHRKSDNYIRYECPCCSAIIRSTSPVKVLCLKCNVEFIH